MSAITRRALLVGALLCAGIARAGFAADISVLSAGAVEPGLRPALAAFEQASGQRVLLSFATAPRIRERVAAGEVFDVLIAPPAVLDELARGGLLAAQRASLGRVGLGIAVRADAPLPDIGDAEAVKRALLEADTLVFNRASTGLYFEALLLKLGIAAQVQGKTVRYADGAAVMEHVLKGQGREIGIGAITEIMLYRDKGLRFVGPLPAALQNYTVYAVSAMAGAGGASANAEALLRHLSSAATAAQFAAAGIEPAP
jgi:molybdate transport system substrate-binding protein